MVSERPRLVQLRGRSTEVERARRAWHWTEWLFLRKEKAQNMLTEDETADLLLFMVEEDLLPPEEWGLPVLQTNAEKSEFVAKLQLSADERASKLGEVEATGQPGDEENLEKSRRAMEKAVAEVWEGTRDVSVFPEGADASQQAARAAAARVMKEREKVIRDDWHSANLHAIGWSLQLGLARKQSAHGTVALALGRRYVISGGGCSPAATGTPKDLGGGKEGDSSGDTGGKFSGKSLEFWAGVASRDAFVPTGDGGFAQVGSFGGKEKGFGYAEGALDMLTSQAKPSTAVSPASRAYQAVGDLAKAAGNPAATEQAQRSLYDAFKAVTDGNALAKEAEIEDARWEPGEKTMGYILDVKGERSGFFSEDVDKLFKRDNDEALRKLLQAGMATRSIENLEETVKKLQEHMQVKASKMETDKTTSAKLFKECIGLTNEVADLRAAYTALVGLERDTPSQAFTRVCDDRRTELKYKAGTRRRPGVDPTRAKFLADIAEASALQAKRRKLDEPAAAPGWTGGQQPGQLDQSLSQQVWAQQMQRQMEQMQQSQQMQQQMWAMMGPMHQFGGPPGPRPPAPPGPPPANLCLPLGAALQGQEAGDRGNGAGARRQTFLPAEYRDRCKQERWEGVAWADGTFLVTAPGRCWRCAGRRGQPGHRLADCPG